MAQRFIDISEPLLTKSDLDRMLMPVMEGVKPSSKY